MCSGENKTHTLRSGIRTESGIMRVCQSYETWEKSFQAAGTKTKKWARTWDI